ncbi:MAG: DNA damage-inducible protein 1 [Phylliscum demangeonii]|nr:MAG: DNA damage-inducible protein 1 [Phylliscum demangeonii]
MCRGRKTDDVGRSYGRDPRDNMRLIISITAPADAAEQDLLALDLDGSMTIADLKASIQGETGFGDHAQLLYHNGQLLMDPSATLEALGVVDGEMLALHVRRISPPPRRTPDAAMGRTASSEGAGTSEAEAAAAAARPDPEMVRLQILGNPRARAEIQAQHPELAAALDQPSRFREVLIETQLRQAGMDRRRQAEIAMLNDSLDPESQAKIEELIRREAVMENLQNAMEHHPEAFGRVSMLYIDVEVNGHKVKAFVDSGAQATIMSPSCAETCGIMRLVDKRFEGIARGVGTATIIGRVHSAQIKIGSLFLACSFTVMEGKDVDLLLGLDMLKRHQACIDLRRDLLVIQGDHVPFLGEADIPKRDDDDGLDEPTVDGPAGLKVGARSGAVIPPSHPTTTIAPRPDPTAPPAVPDHHPPTSSAPAADHPPASSAPPPSQHPPEAIDQLQQLGFSRPEALAALDLTGGNVEMAAGMLFQG